MKNRAEIKQKTAQISLMWEISNNIICIDLLKYECSGPDEQEIKLVWP